MKKKVIFDRAFTSSLSILKPTAWKMRKQSLHCKLYAVRYWTWATISINRSIMTKSKASNRRNNVLTIRENKKKTSLALAGNKTRNQYLWICNFSYESKSSNWTSSLSHPHSHCNTTIKGKKKWRKPVLAGTLRICLVVVLCWTFCSSAIPLLCCALNKIIKGTCTIIFHLSSFQLILTGNVSERKSDPNLFLFNSFFYLFFVDAPEQRNFFATAKWRITWNIHF